jgi:hypothetical protein
LIEFLRLRQDSGEGRWTVEAAIEEAVPADVLSSALYARFRSRQEHTFGEKMLSAMRFGFGGHGSWHASPASKPIRKTPHRSMQMREHLDRLEAAQKTGGNRLFYLATPPSGFLPISRSSAAPAC